MQTLAFSLVILAVCGAAPLAALGGVFPNKLLRSLALIVALITGVAIIPMVLQSPRWERNPVALGLLGAAITQLAVVLVATILLNGSSRRRGWIALGTISILPIVSMLAVGAIAMRNRGIAETEAWLASEPERRREAAEVAANNRRLVTDLQREKETVAARLKSCAASLNAKVGSSEAEKDYRTGNRGLVVLRHFEQESSSTQLLGIDWKRFQFGATGCGSACVNIASRKTRKLISLPLIESTRGNLWSDPWGRYTNPPWSSADIARCDRVLREYTAGYNGQKLALLNFD